MELTVTQENLATALQSVSRVASSRTQLPILSNILVRTDGNRLLIAAMNMEIASTHYIGAKVVKPGAITVPARLITDFVTSLPKGSVELQVTGTKLQLTSGSYKSTINGMTADDFPELPAIDESQAVSYAIAADDFKQAVSQTTIATSSDVNRPVLTGVYWHSHDGYLYLAGTDGYRLAERKLTATKSQVAAIIPKTSLQEVLRAIDDAVETVDVLFDESQVRFRAGEAEITSQLIDGNFPDYRQLIPTTTDTTVSLTKDEFVRITKIAGLFSRDSGGSVVLTADDTTSQLTIHSVASELGENTSETAVTMTGSAGTVSLNSRYISEALAVIDGQEIQFGFSGKLAPCVLKEAKKTTNYKHIIMPLKS